MSKFDIYVKVSILINYKTKQPSNLVWNTSRLCDIGARFSIRLSVHPSVCLLTVLLCRSSTFTSKLVFWSTTILQQPSYLAWHISLTSWLGRYVDPVTLTYILRSIDFDTIYVDVPDLLNYKAYNYQTLHSASLDVLTWQVPWPGDLDLYFALQWLWHILRRRSISPRLYNHQTLQSASSQCTDSADTLTWWPWPIFWLQWLWHNLRQCPRSPQV